MKFILTFIAGVLIGAGGLFAYLRQLPAGAPVVAMAGVSAAMAPGVPQTPAVAIADAALPPAPVVRPNLTEADLTPPPTTPAFPVVTPLDSTSNASAKPAVGPR